MPTSQRLTTLDTAFKLEPFSQTLHMTLEELSPKRTIVKMPVQPWFIVSENRVTQGGLTAALADWAGVFAAMASIETGHTFLTDILNMKFLKSIKEGETMIGHAEVIRTINREIFVDIDVYNEHSEHKAYGRFIFKKPKTP